MKKTEIIPVHANNPQPEAIQKAAALIIAGEVVAFPTETVYGLGANAFNPQAVDKIFIAKGRPAHDPLIVHISTIDDVAQVAVDIPDFVWRLAKNFWPGPLTLVLKRQATIPLNVTAGLDTVAVRVPNHLVALALIKASQTAIAAPSANLFSGVSPTSAQHVLADLDGRIPLILDGGMTSVGVESTVLDCTISPAQVLRPGGVSLQQLREFLGQIDVFTKENGEAQAVRSPGMLDKHYSPRAKLYLCLSTNAEMYRPFFQKYVQQQLNLGQKVGVMSAKEDEIWLKEQFPQVEIITVGSENQPEQIANRLYSALRELDSRRVDCIFSRDFGEAGVALAIRDRLIRAAFEVVRF